jgi:hypothetical protein
MTQKLYSIERKDSGEWVISADDQAVLTCSQKSGALDTIKAATKLLKQAAERRVGSPVIKAN